MENKEAKTPCMPHSKVLKAAIILVITTTVYVAAFTRMGPLPALGPFLNPISGFWRNAQVDAGQMQPLQMDGLVGEVTVAHDESGIPHIYAENDHDLYFVQGYLTARDRLWQMDMSARASAGRLAEILGPSLVDYDTAVRRKGMVMAAERRMQETMKDPRTAGALTSYTAGINAWIAGLTPRDYPVEYKLMGFRPELWSPMKTANVAMGMAQTLSMFSAEHRFSATKATLGEDYLEHLITDPVKWLQTIIPSGHDWGFETLPIPPTPADDFQPTTGQVAQQRWLTVNRNDGSNNWAVHGSRTATGYPILANDPHLNMTLPSIWHMCHLQSPDLNVMGVSIPGNPGIIIGFNSDIAWGVTNTGSDVLDYYQLELDPARENYRYNNEWQPLSYREEIIRIRGRKPLTVRIPYSHHGPVDIKEPSGDQPLQAIAMRWTAHDATNDVLTWYLLNRATNYGDFCEAIANFDNPAQNFAFASRDGDIALRIGGKLPIRWKGQGDAISDGTNPAYDWQGWIPKDQNPGILNPQRGFVSSANQLPADATYPYYLGYSFAPFERGRRINDVLASLEAATVKDMQQLQLDNYSYHAALALPFMLEHLDTAPGEFDETMMLAINALDSWDYMNDPDSIAASIFRLWWSAFSEAAWKNRAGPLARTLLRPDRDQLVEALLDGSLLGEWFDDPETKQQEHLKDLLTRTLQSTIGKMSKEYGNFGESWSLSQTKRARIQHIAQLQGFGSGILPVGGGYESINAIGRSHGPSFRMVVELGPNVRATGVYPGGQSGVPGSPGYTEFIDDWVAGRYFPMVRYAHPNDVPGNPRKQVIFKPIPSSQ